MLLTEIKIKSAKPKDKPYKLADGNGMFLLVHSNGSKYWRLKYRLANKERLLALGVYPEVSLSEARDKRNSARKLIKEGRDPSQQKQIRKQQSILDAAATFEVVAREWHEKNLAKWTPQHGAKILRRLELNIFPVIGRFPIKEIKPSEVLAAIRKVESRNATELSHRILQNCVAVFRYAIANDNADYIGG